MNVVYRADLTVFADYHQFYLADAGTDWQAPEDWADDDLRQAAKMAENVLVICPARNMDVPVSLAVLTSPPDTEFSTADHVLEASLHLPTGQFVVAECTGPDKLRLNLASGWYRVQARFFNLGQAWDDGSGDAYELLIWRDEQQQPLIVHKQWEGDWRG